MDNDEKPYNAYKEDKIDNKDNNKGTCEACEDDGEVSAWQGRGGKWSHKGGEDGDKALRRQQAVAMVNQFSWTL